MDKKSKNEQSDKPKITDWIIGVSTPILVIVTIIYVVFTYQIIRETRKQVALAQDPVIRILPEEDVKGEVGLLKLSLLNDGLSDVKDIQIYEDYFVSSTPRGGPVRLQRYGLFATKPNTVIPSLEQDEKKDFTINFKSIYKEMFDYFNSGTQSHKMMIARLLIKFKRDVDGKKFSYSKAYMH